MYKFRKVAFWLSFICLANVQKLQAKEGHICEWNSDIIILDSLIKNNPNIVLSRIKNAQNSYANDKTLCHLFLLKQLEVFYYINRAKFDSASLLMNDIKAFVANNAMQHKKFISYKADLLNAYFLIRTNNIDQGIVLIDELINTKAIADDTHNLFLAHLYKVIGLQNLELVDSALAFANAMDRQFKNQNPKMYYRLVMVKAFLQRDKENFLASKLLIEPILQEIKTKDKVAYANVCLLLSEVYFQLNNINASKKITDEGLNVLEALQSYVQKPIFLVRRSIIDTAENNYIEAYRNLMSAYEVGNLVYNDRLASITQDNLAKYRADIKEIENRSLKSERIFFTVILLLVSIIAALLVYLLVRLKRIKDKLEESNQFQNKLISIISHDFKSPLYALNDLTNQITYTIKKQNFERLISLADGISTSSIKMANLLNNLLDWAYKNSTQTKIEANVFELVDDVNELYGNIMLTKSVLFYNSIDKHLVLHIKKNVLELIIRNWLDNALKYNAISYIRVGNLKNSNSTVIFIENDGEIQSQLLHNIKEQLNAQAKTNLATANGLGLNLIAQFSKQEGWIIDIETVDKKTIFSITIMN